MKLGPVFGVCNTNTLTAFRFLILIQGGWENCPLQHSVSKN